MRGTSSLPGFCSVFAECSCRSCCSPVLFNVWATAKAEGGFAARRMNQDTLTAASALCSAGAA